MSTEIRFGVIGLGLMGREFASAAARWIHLTISMCGPCWWQRATPTIKLLIGFEPISPDSNSPPLTIMLC